MKAGLHWGQARLSQAERGKVFKPRLHWSGIMLSAACLSSFKRGFRLHSGGCKRKRRFDALGTAVCHVVLHTTVHCCLVHALQSHWCLLPTSKKNLFCVFLSIQCQKHCYIVFQGSWLLGNQRHLFYQCFLHPRQFPWLYLKHVQPFGKCCSQSQRMLCGKNLNGFNSFRIVWGLCGWEARDFASTG